MRSTLMALCLPVLLALAASPIRPAFGADPAGRLFFTPEQRAVLDRLRIDTLERLRTGQPPPVEDKGETPAGGDGTREAPLVFQGIVLRSSGRHTIWLNDRAYHENQTPAGVKPVKWAGRNRMAIALTHNDVVVTIKPGETVLIHSGEPAVEQNR